jgi:hypothetical protein
MYKFDSTIQSSVIHQDPYTLSRDAFMKTYGDIIYRKYCEYCIEPSSIHNGQRSTPYIKIIFSQRMKQAKEKHNLQRHHIPKVTSVVERTTVVKGTHQLTTHKSLEHNPQGPPTIISESVFKDRIINKTSETTMERVAIHQSSDLVLCALEFAQESKEIETQTIIPQLSISCDSLDIQPVSEVLEPMKRRGKQCPSELKAQMVNSILIQAPDHYVALDAPSKPMYRNFRSVLGLGRLCESISSVRELWLTQEIFQLRGEIRQLWEQQDSLTMSRPIEDDMKVVDNNDDAMQAMMQQLSEVMKDDESTLILKSYFG